MGCTTAYPAMNWWRPTVVNTVNNEQVGPIVDFVIQNCDKMGAVSFQPVSFTGRDEHISDEARHRQRYTAWNLLWVGGMWFQDLWTYDFRRTEMCVIPYGTQEGEISFCAYNTGVGWRQVVENLHMVASTKDWFKERGRHQIYAGNRPMDLPGKRRSLPVIETVVAGTSN